MCRDRVVFGLIVVLLFGTFSSVSATPPSKILSGIASNLASGFLKWLLSLKSNTKTALSSPSMMKFEDGYIVETLFDGSKLGIEPYYVDMASSGDLLVLDSENSNIYKISMPFSSYTRPKLVAGSAKGYSGHVDGKRREARLNHPKGLTVDDKGNIYVADTMNMAIRKISDSGVTTIAGGKWSRGGGGHVDGPSEDAKLSDDFDVVYIRSSCSLLVIDRGNQAIREIQLQSDDCSNYQHDITFPLGIAVLAGAGFFGYMLAWLQYRVRPTIASKPDSRTCMGKATPVPPYQKAPKSFRPPLIPSEVDPETSNDGVFTSFCRLFLNTSSSIAEIFGYRKKKFQHELHHLNTWPMQESYVVPHNDEPPPSIETRSPTHKNAYPFMTNDFDKSRNLKQSRGSYGGWDGEYYQQQQQQKQHRHYSSEAKTYYEQSCETNEIVFGAVQEQDGRQEAVVIKAVDYGDSGYNSRNTKPRLNYAGYSCGY